MEKSETILPTKPKKLEDSVRIKNRSAAPDTKKIGVKFNYSTKIKLDSQADWKEPEKLVRTKYII